MVLIMINLMVLLLVVFIEKGVVCVSMEDCCWLNCQIKLMLLLGNVLVVQFVVEYQVIEVIQFCDGYLLEVLFFNVWVVKDGKIFVLFKDNLILEGICYGLMEELCVEQGIVLELCCIMCEELLVVDEFMIFLVSKEVLLVVMFDGQLVGSGQLGLVFVKVYVVYQVVKVRFQWVVCNMLFMFCVNRLDCFVLVCKVGSWCFSLSLCCVCRCVEVFMYESKVLIFFVYFIVRNWVGGLMKIQEYFW